MNTPNQFKRLFDNLRRAADAPPNNLADALRAQPEVGELPLPWSTWALVVLARLLRRQAWARALVQERLLDHIPPLRKLGDRPLVAVLRGAPEWEVGIEAQDEMGDMINRVTGENIPIDLCAKGDRRIFCDRHFVKNLGSRPPGEPESRLQQLHPSPHTFYLALGELEAAGLVEEVRLFQECYRHRLTKAALAHAEVLAHFGDLWSAAANRTWLAALAGDWLAVHDAAEAAGDRELVDLSAARAARCREVRIELLRQGLKKDRPVCVPTLIALREAGAGDVPDLLRAGLKKPVRHAEPAVMVVEQIDDPALCPEVFRLYLRALAGGTPKGLALASRCARFLARHDYRSLAVVRTLMSDDKLLFEAALLALDRLPERALTVFRRALESSDPYSGSQAAAALALIDRPWSCAELLALLGRSASPKETMFVRAALRECSDPDARRAVDRWEECHPVAGPEDAMGIPGFPVTAAWSVQREMEQIRDRVIPLRDRTPGLAPLRAASPAGRRADAGKAPVTPVGGPTGDVEASSRPPEADPRSCEGATALDACGEGNTGRPSPAPPVLAWRERLGPRRRPQEDDVR